MTKMKMPGLFPSRFGFFPYVFLIYMLFPAFSLLKETGMKQLVGYGMLMLFFITYRQLYFTIGKRAFTYWLALQLSIIFIYCIFYGLSYVFLGFFPANFTGYYRENTKFYRGLTGLTLVLLVPLLYHIWHAPSLPRAGELLFFIPFLIVMLISPFGLRSIVQKRELERKLDQANQRIAELIKREERVRISRDLHDKLGHTLSLLTLKSQLVQRLISIDTERAQQEAKEIELTSRAVLKQVRELVSDLRTITIAEELVQIQQILRAANFTYQYSTGVDFSKIPPLTQNIVSLCIREAVTNVVKHSKATHCILSISQSAENVKIVIQDNGKGIDENKPMGNGLRGMEERLQLINGELHFYNQNGTILELSIPMIKKEQEEVVL